MHFKALVSALALGTAITLSGPVSAMEMMIDGVMIVIPEDEMVAVENRCQELAEAAENESLSTSTTEEDDSVDSAGEAGALIEDAPEVNTMVDATTEVDLETIDLQGCIDAGIVDDQP